MTICYENLLKACNKYEDAEDKSSIEKEIYSYFTNCYKNKEEFNELADFFKKIGWTEYYEKSLSMYLAFKANELIFNAEKKDKEILSEDYNKLCELFKGSSVGNIFSHYLTVSLKLKGLLKNKKTSSINLKNQLQIAEWGYKENLYLELIESVVKVSKHHTQAAVVVISNGTEEYILESLNEINKQNKYNKYKIVFVSNNKENVTDKVLSFVDTLISMKENSGAYLARNIGSLYSYSDIVVFLEDDGLPQKGFVEEHLKAHLNNEVVSVRGSCLSKTNGVMPGHYWLGMYKKPCPPHLEGNCSFKVKEFFKVGGWGDYIMFGHGGIEICHRMITSLTKTKQHIYSPSPVLYHNWTKKTDEAMKEKSLKQHASWQALKFRYDELHNLLKKFD